MEAVMKDGQGLDFLPCYAIKVNYNPALLKIIHDMGFGADVVSGGEFYFALRAGFSNVIVELGRSIISSAPFLVSKVICRKETESKQFLIVDAAMNSLLRSSLYNAHNTNVTTIAEAQIIEDIAGQYEE